jgi:hypothetical protein
MKRTLVITAAVWGLLAIASSATEAGSLHLVVGPGYGAGSGYGVGYGHGQIAPYSGSITPQYGYGVSLYSYPTVAPHYDWHDTSHYDYHAPELIRHGNHYHYQPGHYDLHRTGHWDLHHGGHVHH